MRTSATGLCLAVWIAGAADAHEPTLSRFNYREHVRPLFLRHCGGCHYPGGVAPMSLLDYQEAVPWANAIKLSLLERRMPPFLPSDDDGPFRDARTLTAHELDTLLDWAVGATPEGETLAAEESPSPPGPPEADLLLRAPSDVVLEKDDPEKTACVLLPTGLADSRLVTGLEVFAGQPSILRRATILVGDSCSDGEPLATWLPDRGRVSFPEGLGRRLDASSSLVLELRYKKRWGDEGKRVLDRSALGLWFSKDAVPVRSVAIEKLRLDLDEAVRLVALYATSADEPPLRVEAVAPDGTTRRLLSIERFDPAWNEKYFFHTPSPRARRSASRTPAYGRISPTRRRARTSHDPPRDRSALRRPGRSGLDGRVLRRATVPVRS
ncbi:MAG: hypothetical protein ACRD1Z_06370 [Vicinamibacteria bacterium]